MRGFVLFQLSALLSGVVVLAQPNAEKGAKALFLDTQTGRMAMPTVRPAGPNPASAPTKVPAITGLMYYFELLQPNGELIRVNSSRVFHSGEKFRLHVTTNIDGRLTILQSQNGGRFEELFPSPKLPESAPFVRKGIDTVLPAPGAWFKFDERSGDIQLLMMLSAESGVPIVASSAPPSHQTGTASASAEVDEKIGAMRAFEQLQRGSKALRIETDSSPRDAFEVRLVDSEKDRRVPPGKVVVELKLQQRLGA